MQSAVAVLLRRNPDVPVHVLPVSWWLPASAAATVVSEAFYPFTGFRTDADTMGACAALAARFMQRGALLF
jgi:hypothetical protein